MAKKTSQFDLRLKKWAAENGVEDLIKDKEVFVVVDKYNKPIESGKISQNRTEKLSAAHKQKLEILKSKLPYETLYFTVVFDKRNSVFLIRKKTPIQNVLNIWAIIMIVWALYRWHFQTFLPIWVDEFIAKPLVFITPIFFYITRVEKKKFLEGVTLNKPLSPRSLSVGVVIGVIFFVTGFLSFYLKQQSLSISSILSQLSTPVWLIIIVAIATSISEEIVSRGFVLKRLYEDSKNMYSSAFYASVLFFFMHIPIFFTNQNIVGSALLQIMATDLLFSFAVSFIYLQSKNLYLPILIHEIYNISIYLFSTSK
jgi:membrane protease YdiL (CAAX protease family)